jgi:hypothetical protein
MAGAYGLSKSRNFTQNKEKTMARKKRSSLTLQTARHRLAGLNSITPPPDFGDSLTLTAYNTQITSFASKLDNYNKMVSVLDDLQNEIDGLEETLGETNQRMLAATAAHFGTDSSQYEQAGGKRMSERKRPARKASTQPEP